MPCVDCRFPFPVLVLRLGSVPEAEVNVNDDQNQSTERQQGKPTLHDKILCFANSLSSCIAAYGSNLGLSSVGRVHILCMIP